MRKRTDVYTPCPVSSEYSVGTVSVKLLPGVNLHLARRLEERLALTVGPKSDLPDAERLNDFECAMLFTALMAYYLWDDDTFEFDDTSLDPEKVLFLEGDDLVSFAHACQSSIYGRKNMAMGFAPFELTAAVNKAFRGETGK